MQSLYLNVKYRVRVDGNARALHHEGGEILFVLMLDIAQTLKHRRVVGIFFKIGKLLGVLAVSRSYALVKQRGKARVGVAEPAAVSHAVRNVGAALGIHAVKALEERFLEYLRVEL